MKKTLSYMQFNVANKIDVGTSRCIDKDTTFISSVLLLKLKSYLFFWCLLCKGTCKTVHGNLTFTTRCKFINAIWRQDKIGTKVETSLVDWRPMAHKKFASHAGERPSTENQNESNRKGELYSGEETMYFLTMVLQSCSN